MEQVSGRSQVLAGQIDGVILPTPIAVYYETACGSQYAAANRWDALPQAVEQALRVLGSTLLAGYFSAEAHSTRPRLNNLIGQMQRPDLGTWIALVEHFVRTQVIPGSKVFQQFHAALHEAYVHVKTIQVERQGNPILEFAYKLKPHDIPERVPFLKAIQEMRNNNRAHFISTIGRGSETFFVRCLEILVPHLRSFFRALAPLWSFSLEIAASDNERFRFVGEAPIRIAATPASWPLKTVLLVSPDGEIASLFPFLLPSDDCAYLLLFDGYVLDPEKPDEPSDGVSYQGATPEWRGAPLASALKARFKARGICLQKRDRDKPWTLARSLRDRSSRLIQTTFRGQLLEDTFLERKMISDPLWRFLHASLPENSGNSMILTGRSGTGKSALLYKATNRMLEIPEGQPGSENIVLYLRCDKVAEKDEGALYTALLNQVNDTSRQASAGKRASVQFEEFFRRLGQQLQFADYEDRKFILIVDAVNEAPNPERFYRHLLDLVEIVSAYPWVRVVTAIREEFLELFRVRLNSLTDPLYTVRSCLFFPSPSEDPLVRHPSLPVWVVPELSTQERATLYRTYQEKHQDNPTICKACPTPWTEITPESREILNTPLRIILWMKTFDGRPAGAVSDLVALFTEYLKVLTERAPTLMNESLPQVIDYMIEHGRVLLDCDDDLALRKSSNGDPIAAMVHEGIMDRELTNRHQVVYKIYHQRLAEALMAECLWAQATDRRTDAITLEGVARWGAPPLNQELIGALEYILQERLLSKRRYLEATYILDKIDFQLSPQNSWLFTTGHIESSVRFRKELAGALESSTAACRNAYQLSLGFIRLGECENAVTTIESIKLESSNTLPPHFQAAVIMYKALALNTSGQPQRAYSVLHDARRLARDSPIEGNVCGTLATVKMKLLGFDRCRRSLTWAGIQHRLRELLLLPWLYSISRDFDRAIRINAKYEDVRSTTFWSGARSHFIGVLGWHERSALELEKVLSGCQARERDAHCLLFINRYLGEVFSVSPGCAERALNHINSAKQYALEIGDRENIRELDELAKSMDAPMHMPAGKLQHA